ncbi:MAG: DUF4037 domain-containing protein [Jiangellaceae bacterium]|nr:DUF4037 domain-containing protein [Jiangellaceae bacterium]
MPPFIPGLELSRRFYVEAVQPILATCFPNLPHAAGRLGWGSEVLGFDTEMSTDHAWGPIVQLFLRDEDLELADDVRDALDRELPAEFAGYPVRFPFEDAGRPAAHWVEPTAVRALALNTLGYDLDRPLEVADWLTFPSQKLRALRVGAVYQDSVGELTALRERLAYYPRQVWLYLLAAGWRRIDQEEHLMPRAGVVGDELGSSLIGSRLVRDVMRLCFLMERQYAPYAKWFGTAFSELPCAPELSPVLWRAQRAATWEEREAALCEAYEELARMHNALQITAELRVTTSAFFRRPFRVIGGQRFADAIVATIDDPDVRLLADRRLIGGIDQVSDNTDLLEGTQWRGRLRWLYE